MDKIITYTDKPQAISVGKTPDDTITVVESNKVMVFEDIDNWKAVRVDDDGRDEQGHKRPLSSCWIYDDKGKYVAFINYEGHIDFVEQIGTKYVTKPIEQTFDPSRFDELKQAVRYIYIVLQQPNNE